MYIEIFLPSLRICPKIFTPFLSCLCIIQPFLKMIKFVEIGVEKLKPLY